MFKGISGDNTDSCCGVRVRVTANPISRITDHNYFIGAIVD